MNLLKAIWLAEIHRETYVAILKSWIPHGEKGGFARRVGISKEYLSYLCALDRPAEGRCPGKRMPSPGLARKIAAALPAPLEVKQSLIENMELAHANSARARYITREFIDQRQGAELLSEIGQAHQLATFGTGLTEVKRAYRSVRDAAAGLIPHLSPEIYPASLAQACLFLHDAQCVLDRADDALRYAKLALLVLDNSDFFEVGFDKEQVANLEINAIRGEGVALHNLGLDREAQYSYLRARTAPAYRNTRNFWEPLVERDLLNAMVNIPRFGFRDAQRLSREIEGICERNGDEFTLFLVRESWLRCLIQRKKWKQAERLFHQESERFPSLPYAGSLHKALFAKTGALLAWKLGDIATWRKRIGNALELMHHGGLNHQLRTVKQFYGENLRDIMDSLGSPR